ncbi:MAG: tetratricopeptide repeat protein [Burkholderiales bacterium]
MLGIVCNPLPKSKRARATEPDMSASRYVHDASADNFNTLVLGNSMKGPVLVNFWSRRAAPCFLLMPRLVRLCTEYGGKFLLVMFNTDEFGRLARDYAVTSVPTVKVFVHGKVVETVHGAQPDSELRRVIDRFVARKSDAVHAVAVTAAQRGDDQRAFELLAQARAQDPQNLRIPIDHAKLLVLRERYAEAEEMLQSLPANAGPEAEVLLAHLGFLRIAQNAAPMDILWQKIDNDPDDLEARYTLSAVMLVDDDYEGAMDQLLEIARRDRAFRDDAGRRGMLAVFTLLGNSGELVERYRKRLYDGLNPLTTG